MAQRWFLVLLLCTAAGKSVRAQSSPKQIAVPTHVDPPGAGTGPFLGCGKANAMAGRLLRHLDDAGGKLGTNAVALEAPGDTDVLHYDLDLEVSNLNPALNTCTIGGTAIMTIESKSPALTEFTFRLRNQYTITGSLINGVTPITVTTDSITTRTAVLDRAYGMDEIFTLTIAYTGPTVSRGLGSINVENQFGTPVVMTLSEPYFSYTWWPVKDGDTSQPGDNSEKATLDFKMTVPDNYVAASNGLLQSVDDLGGGRLRYHWATSYPIAPYLVCFAATDYNTWTQTYTYPGGTMPVEFFIYPGNDTPTNRASWEKVLDMLPVFAGIYGEYPFVDEKYGIYNFNFLGGMEHQTMTGQGTFDESVTAHELSHQWWGDMVTCRTWNDLWLNEGFATYSECLWEERKSGGIDSTAYFNAILARDPILVGSSVYVPTASLGDLNRLFSPYYTYRKGAWVLHHLRRVLGETMFFDTLADYRAAYAYSAATTDDFAAVASARYGSDLSWFFDQWVYEPGAPAYEFGGKNVTVDGQKYLLVHVTQTQSPGYPNVYTMPVEFVLTIGGVGSSYDVWNDARQEWSVLPVSDTVTGLQFDPAPWILRTSTVGVTYVAGPPTVIAADPAPGNSALVGEDLDTITITFHTDVDDLAADYSVVGDATGPRSFTLSGGAAANEAILNLDSPLPADSYTVTVSANLTATNSGLALDGEIDDPNDPGAFPTGDGLPGGDAVYRFQVTSGTVQSDLDGDGDVDGNDFLTFSNCFNGALNPPGPLCVQPLADLDGDGDVDGNDFLTLSNCFNGALNPPICP